MSKQELRKRLKLVLESISSTDLHNQSKRIATALEPLLAGYAHIGCYINMDSAEAQTDSILKSLFQSGKSVYLPRCTSTKRTGQVKLYDPARPYERHLTFHKMPSMEEVRQLTPAGKYGLREPMEVIPAPLPPPELEVLLVPGVAFDICSGSRLGHGAGYYDDYIHRCLHYNKKRPLLVGIALKEQLITGIPLEAHDIAMDVVVCGDGAIHWRSNVSTDK